MIFFSFKETLATAALFLEEIATAVLTANVL
jgi:hypothetical protein